MSKQANRGLRVHALAAATAVVLASSFATASAAERLNLSSLSGSDTHDRFIVRFKEGTAERANPSAVDAKLDAAARAVAASARGKGLKVGHLRRMSLGADVIRTDRKLSRIEAEQLMRQIAADPNVEYVEADQILHPLLNPNDTRYNEQWGFFDSDAGIRAPQAWDKATGQGVVVAVIDTGITSHSDLNANVLPGYDFIGDVQVAGDGNGRDSDASDPGDAYGGYPSSWHGTHVAGTVAALTNNGNGVAGTAFNARILPVRVLGKGGGYTSDIADGITWASGGSVSGVPANPNPAEVLNLSLGSRSPSSCSSTTQNALQGAVNRGSIVVVAAGNSNGNVLTASGVGYTMGNCGNVIVVGSHTSTGARSSFSNYGSGVDLSGPGSSILSTLNSGTSSPGSETYASYSGTSMASPHVAGVAALVQSVASTPLTHSQMRTLLRDNTRPFPSTPSQPIGTGIVDANASVDAVGGGGGNTPPVANFSSSVSGLTVSFTDTSSDSDGSIASRSWNFGDGTTSTATNPSKTYSAAGTYTVTLTVTDDDGATNAKSSQVTVSSGGGGSVLQNGVPVTGISGAQGSQQFWTMNVPAGSSNLQFQIAGGSGDADMYVRFGSAPTTSSYNCRPYLNGNNETCTFSAPQAGTYHVMLRGYTSYSGVSLTGSYSAGGGGGPQTYSNGTDVNIPDNTTVESPISVSGRSGNAGSSVPVAVNIVHTYIGDLKVDLVAPDGSVYVLHNRSGGSANNINQTYNVNLSSEALNGTWKLRVNDNANFDTGYINNWSVTF